MGEPTEACRPVGHKAHMPLMNQIRGEGTYAPDEFKDSMFLPLMKRALIGGIGD